MSAAEGFRYLSPWLPMKDGWYRLGHVGARTSDIVHRWRLYKTHEKNEATGERWERWRLFYDHAMVNEGNACPAWSSAQELPVAAIRDRSHAGMLVEQRFADLCEELGKQRRRGRGKAAAS